MELTLVAAQEYNERSEGISELTMEENEIKQYDHRTRYWAECKVDTQSSLN